MESSGFDTLSVTGGCVQYSAIPDNSEMNPPASAGGDCCRCIGGRLMLRFTRGTSQLFDWSRGRSRLTCPCVRHGWGRWLPWMYIPLLSIGGRQWSSG